MGEVLVDDDCLYSLPGAYNFDSKRAFNGGSGGYDPNERRRPPMMAKPPTGGRIPLEDNYSLPPIGKNSMMASMEEEMDSYFEPQEEVVAERPTTIEKNVFSDSGVDSSISLTPDGKRLRRKSRRQSTTSAPTTTTEAPTTASPRFLYTLPPLTTTAPAKNVPDFFAQNKPQFGTMKDEFDNYWSGDIGVSLQSSTLNSLYLPSSYSKAF